LPPKPLKGTAVACMLHETSEMNAANGVTVGVTSATRKYSKLVPDGAVKRCDHDIEPLLRPKTGDPAAP
jgi:hypothetical protein